MILAAGLTPAWQQTLSLRSFRVGQVNRAREASWCGAGKVLNVGMALHRLGAESCTVALLGGEAGRQIAAEFEAEGVTGHWVWSRHPTRVCTTILDEATGVTTELVENGHPPSEEELEVFIEAYEQRAASARLVVLSGSLPGGVSKSFYKELVERTRARVILDVRGPELERVLGLEPWIVKPNREELGQTVGRELTSEDEVVAAMMELNERGAGWVVVTHGRDSVLASARDEIWRFDPLRVDTVNPIGCGDCLAAGMAWALGQEGEVPPAIALGIAAAAQNAAELLPSRLDAVGVKSLAAQVQYQRLT